MNETPNPKPRILNVDDDEAGRYVVTRDLTREGFEVVEAATGEESLRLMGKMEFDLVVLDIRLPDTSGFEICRRIRENPRTHRLPVLLMSASFVDSGSKVTGLEGGADGYLTEPVESAVLLATIKSLLRLKQAEKAVVETARQWRTTFNAIQDGVALLDRNGVILRSNSAFDRIAQPNGEDFNRIIDAAFATTLSILNRHASEHPVGSRVVTVTMDPVLTESGELSAVVCIAADVTDKKQFEQQLQHTQKLESIGVLAGGIAHDFNNLLTGVLGNASLLLSDLAPGGPEYELASQILKASESAASLTRQILAYSGKGRYVVEAVNLSAVAFECRSLTRRFIPKDVNLIYNLAQDLPAIEGDRGQLEQVIMNLIINAAESFGESGRGVVTVKTALESLDSARFEPGDPNPEPGPFVSLTVSDNGSGMDKNTQQKIFDPFFTTKFVGRGLGLSAVQGIVRGHHGLLRLRSQVGEGSTFDLFFPIAEGRSSSSESAPRKDSQGSGTILVIDDEIAVRQFARNALERKGYKILAAENGQIGVDIFRESHRDISAVLLDFSMPVMDGEEALKHLQRIDPTVPIVLSSGFNQDSTVQRFDGKGLAGFIAKPYTAAQLHEVITLALEKRHT